MSRRPRLFVPGCVYHVMARGLDGAQIFGDEADRDGFLGLLSYCIGRSGTRCYAWALMSNHYHLVIRTGDQPLARLMKPLNSRYAGYFNRRYNRRGYLFQDRFKSLATQDQEYIAELVRYVHLNPVRAGVCRDLGDLDTHQWCGHGTLMGTQQREFQDTRTVLLRFGNTDSEARRAYREYLAEGIADGVGESVETIRTSSRHGQNKTEPGRWVIGDREFVAQALEVDRQKRLHVARYIRDGIGLENVCRLVADRMGIAAGEIVRKSARGEVSEARKVAAYFAHRKMEVPILQIARHFGVGGSAVSMMLRAGEKIADERKLDLLTF